MITTIKKIKPMFNGVVTTLNKYPLYTKTAGSSLIDATKSGAVKEYQTVLAIGPMVKGIDVGDVVFINPKRYAVMKHKEGTLQDGVIKDNPVVAYNFDIVEVDGQECLYLYDNDIKFVAEVEEFEECPNIITEEHNKILN